MSPTSTEVAPRRQEHWEAAYERNLSDAMCWFQGQPKLSLRFIHQTGTPQEAALLEVGG